MLNNVTTDVLAVVRERLNITAFSFLLYILDVRVPKLALSGI
jgi:hypothetical protein